MFGTRTILGLAVDETGIVAAELEVRAGRPRVRRAGELRWEQEFRPENMRALGERVRQFLRDRQFSAKQAVIGIAAKWILAREIAVPPASTETLAGMLSIQAERTFSLNTGELVFDYCGRTDASEKGQVLLLAAPRQFLQQIGELARSAGLQVQALTVSALALGTVLSEAGREQGYGLYVRPTYCEFWSQWNGRPQFLNHIPMTSTDGSPDDYTQALVSTIRRSILLSSPRESSGPRHVTAYDARGGSEDLVAPLGERLAPEIAVIDGSAVLPSPGLGATDGSPQVRSVAAAAVALTVARGDGPAVDFLNPKIGHKKTTSRKRVVVWVAIVGVASLVALGALLADWRRNVSDIAAYTRQLEQMSDDITAARELVERVAYAGSWTSRQPQFLACLRALTEAFPQEPRIWATSLALNENGKGALVGKTDREESFYEVLDKIKENQAFSEVTMVHIRDVGRDSREKEFAINFKFQSAK
jgi:hypothetical protein